MDSHQIAWFAGLMDGEGSIGIGIESKPKRTVPSITLRPAVQMSTTSQPTLVVVIALLQEMGLRGLAYTYQERDPAKQLDAWFLRINRLIDIALVAEQVLPYAVTKQRQWELMLAFAKSRLDGVRTDALGRVHRGGDYFKPFSQGEIEIARQLRELNLRGPAAIQRNAEWLSKLALVEEKSGGHHP